MPAKKAAYSRNARAPLGARVVVALGTLQPHAEEQRDVPAAIFSILNLGLVEAIGFGSVGGPPSSKTPQQSSRATGMAQQLATIGRSRRSA